jgi:hypothetical protein
MHIEVISVSFVIVIRWHHYTHRQLLVSAYTIFLLVVISLLLIQMSQLGLLG